MSIVILFAIVFQSVHSYEHLTKELTEKKCIHKHNSSKEITHQHKSFDHCFVCDFCFSNFISSDYINYNYQKIVFISESPFSDSKQIINYFKGALFSLRAPPRFIV
jgi:hypothetical protein